MSYQRRQVNPEIVAFLKRVRATFSDDEVYVKALAEAPLGCQTGGQGEVQGSTLLFDACHAACERAVERITGQKFCDSIYTDASKCTPADMCAMLDMAIEMESVGDPS